MYWFTYKASSIAGDAFFVCAAQFAHRAPSPLRAANVSSHFFVQVLDTCALSGIIYIRGRNYFHLLISAYIIHKFLFSVLLSHYTSKIVSYFYPALRACAASQFRYHKRFPCCPLERRDIRLSAQGKFATAHII